MSINCFLLRDIEGRLKAPAENRVECVLITFIFFLFLFLFSIRPPRTYIYIYYRRTDITIDIPVAMGVYLSERLSPNPSAPRKIGWDLHEKSSPFPSTVGSFSRYLRAACIYFASMISSAAKNEETRSERVITVPRRFDKRACITTLHVIRL